LLLLNTVPGFEGLLEKIFLNQLPRWKQVLDSTSPAQDIGTLAASLTSKPFEVMCIVRCMRPDCVVPEVNTFTLTANSCKD